MDTRDALVVDRDAPPPATRELRPSPDALRRAAVHEAVTLPWLFLSAALLASLHLGDRGALAFTPPSLMSLVLGVLFAGLIVQVGVAHLPALVSPRRLPLENASGVMVLVLLLVAGAQVIDMLTPNRGIFSFVVATYFLFLFTSTLAARPAPQRLLQSLAVTCGGALLLKFVVLSGVAAPGGTLAARLFASALDGITLGALGAEFQPPAAGYLAFAALLLLFVGLSMLPRRP